MAPIEFRENLLSGLGGAWPAGGELNARVLKSERHDGYRLHWIQYDAEIDDAIPAILLVPDHVDSDHPAPGICVWHQHAGQWHLGKTEPAGLAGNPMHHTGVALVKQGYVVLCPDALGFEERAKGYQLQGRNLERFLFLKYVVQGKCMAWKNILDMKRAVDLLCSRPEVDASRLGCYGHSMGSTHMFLVGPWEPRLKAFVGNCCLPTYEAIHEKEILHCFPNYIPGIYPEADTPDVVALIAPRALHLNFGELDGGSPIEYVRKGLPVIEQAYQRVHADDKFSYYIEEGSGHILSDEMWDRTKQFFKKNLSA